MQRLAQFFDQCLLAFVRLGQHIDAPLHRLESRTVFGWQYAEIEIVRVWRHDPIIPPRRSSLMRKEQPDLLCRSRCPYPSSIDTAPIQALDKASNCAFESRITPSLIAGQANLPPSRRL